MKRIFLAAAVLAALAPRAPAQFERENRYSPSDVSAYGVWHFSDADRDRLNHAEKELREFAEHWSKARFDKGNLDDAISAIQHVLDNNRMPPQDRDALSDDVARLRRMRDAYEHHEIG